MTADPASSAEHCDEPDAQDGRGASGPEAPPYRSNIPKLADFAFGSLDDSYPQRATECRETGHIVVDGDNYGQGSSREHATIAPRHLGLRLVLAKSHACIHSQDLINFGVLPLEFTDPEDHDDIEILRAGGLIPWLRHREPRTAR